MHATTLELESYVAGGLDPARVSELDVHVERCAECARALLREARLEVAVRVFASELRCGMRADVVEVPAAPAPAPTARSGFYALAALAAALLAFAATHLPHVPFVAPAPAVLLTDAGDFTAVHRPSVFVGEPSGGTP
jgi:anti-sigma factor RsiW